MGTLKKLRKKISYLQALQFIIVNFPSSFSELGLLIAQ